MKEELNSNESGKIITHIHKIVKKRHVHVSIKNIAFPTKKVDPEKFSQFLKKKHIHQATDGISLEPYSLAGA